MTAIASPPSKFEVATKATPNEQISALIGGVGVVALDETGWIRVTGEDRVRWLNGMTTNSIQELVPGAGNYNFFLSAQGRIQGDAYAFAEESAILLHTDRASISGLMELLDRFVIMDDVELFDVSADCFGLLCAGPGASQILQAIGIEVAKLDPLHRTSAMWGGKTITVIRAYGALVPRFELWAEDAETVSKIAEALCAAGAIGSSAETMNQLRILEGTPLYGTDIRDKELPQETAQTRALHFAKGCYLGQEIVERIRSRGNVHRTLHGFELMGELPASGAVLEADGKTVGELTSVAEVPLASGAVRLALGYIRREVVERASTITYPGGIAIAINSPYHALPKE